MVALRLFIFRVVVVPHVPVLLLDTYFWPVCISVCYIVRSSHVIVGSIIFRPLDYLNSLLLQCIFVVFALFSTLSIWLNLT